MFAVLGFRVRVWGSPGFRIEGFRAEVCLRACFTRSSGIVETNHVGSMGHLSGRRMEHASLVVRISDFRVKASGLRLKP